MCYTLGMNRRQKGIIAALALANGLLFTLLAVLVTSRSTTRPPPLARTSPPPTRTAHGVCEWKAAQQLAQAGLPAAVTLAPDGSLRFKITHPLAPDEMADEAAQSVWTAFDVALAVQHDQCGTFRRIEVTIAPVRIGADNEGQIDEADLRITASVTAADLAGYGAGDLSEDEFIERVTYSTSRPSHESGPAQAQGANFQAQASPCNSARTPLGVR